MRGCKGWEMMYGSNSAHEYIESMSLRCLENESVCHRLGLVLLVVRRSDHSSNSAGSSRKIAELDFEILSMASNPLT